MTTGYTRRPTERAPMASGHARFQRAWAGALCLLLSSCLGGPTLDEASCPTGGTSLGYESFGKPFMDAYCQRCHGSAAKDRKGAPDTYAFDTREEVVRHAERIYARAAGENDSMPPGPDDPSDEERDRLGEWLACGAPP